ncbi:hypothetical protein BDV06DRAFT_232845 [Aspergillus oleicola]
MSSNIPARLRESVEKSKCEYRRLGNSGLRVSVPIFGCMSFGDPNSMSWTIGKEIALPLLKAAYDRGFNTWDMANIYCNGALEEIVGKALKTYSIPQEKVVIMTKCFWAVSKEPESIYWFLRDAFEKSKDYQDQFGLSRATIFNQVEASLKRLGTDYINLLQIHHFDSTTPIEGTMKVLHGLVQSGKVRYIGASSMWATQSACMQFCAEINGWTKFVSMQSQYNLLYREDEREVIRFCNDTGVGLIPWAPLAQGNLARPPSELGTTIRSKLLTENTSEPLLSEADLAIIGRVMEIAEKHGCPMAQVALAWINKRITGPIIGFSSIQRLEQAITVRGKLLFNKEEKYIEEPYQPKAVIVAESL